MEAVQTGIVGVGGAALGDLWLDTLGVQFGERTGVSRPARCECLMDDYAIVTAMTRFGGSFAQALAEAWRCADYENQSRITQTWPDLCGKRARMSDWTHGERRSRRDFVMGQRPAEPKPRTRKQPAPPVDRPPFICERCYGRFDELLDVQTMRQTMSSPAEHEMLCRDCAWPFLDHDPLDREPTEDELEERRRR